MSWWQRYARRLLSDLHTVTAPGDLVITPTLNLVETLEKTYNPPEPEQADSTSASTSITSSIPSTQLRLFLRLKFEAMIIPERIYAALALAFWTPVYRMASRPIPDLLKITPSGLAQIDYSTGEGEQDFSGASIRWRVVVYRLVQASIPLDQVIRLTRGLSATQTEKFLTAWLPLDQPAVVAITPAWWPRLPSYPPGSPLWLQVEWGRLPERVCGFNPAENLPLPGIRHGQPDRSLGNRLLADQTRDVISIAS